MDTKKVKSDQEEVEEVEKVEQTDGDPTCSPGYYWDSTLKKCMPNVRK